MFETPLNYKTVTLKLKRIEICDLLLATLAAKQLANDGGKKWEELHDKLKTILDDFDEKNA